jgi:aldehyde:ferredoxin oxidoreductase
MLPQIVRPKPGGVHQRASLSAGEDIQQSLSEVRRDLVEKAGLPEEETDRMFTTNDFNYGMVLKHSEDAEAVCTSLGTCVAGGPDDPGRDIPWLSEIYPAATGFSATPKELRSKGERIRNMEALLNVREGIMGEDYEPPALWLEHTEKPIRVGNRELYATDWFGRRITKNEIYKWMRDYYTERGWDIKNRIPTRENLRELGLEEFMYIVEPYLA